MASIVVIDANNGSLDRYEIGGEAVRKTHACTLGEKCYFTPEIIETFRLNPSPEFAVDPPPRPTNSPAGAGTAYARAA